ncbi:Na+/H+ antiporter NhaA [Rhodoblastus acidophilus]|uniref:Na(+)/H(+) antiporter NhaA n=1 Tax=Candidatus Rhodoblastus alkanivorans TaxID=2954117 RepID=A0ABS9Z739_9HYPH|nr:Na+/H+ antiporter NhaA [Candidatus Rhodoblastus alkanivorans]MCI4679608.1 Na+/H+ antiporter NhaA [Candidatus Rhodoblastus alkanivorans]MCI4683433.1 Na+/H+ antiporter NhaA [Candidatus Rhodoblastus alkanivorans]MDI4640743.1 Na+/H+ antiporter NhaA [Rhodoblastus acidophilus]
MIDGLAHLPKEPADRLTAPFLRFVRVEAIAGAVLLLFALIALALANSSWSARYLSFWEIRVGFSAGDVEFARSLKHWINDGLMTFFFFVVALELKREMILGELNSPRRAAFPMAGALGGMIVPAGLYLLLVGGRPVASGWGTVMSTDTALLIGCLAVLGRRIPESLRLFLLALAIFDDVGAILVVAIWYGHTLNWIPLALAGVGVVAVAGVARLGIRSMLVYFAIGGGIWLALDASGVHATLTGVILGLMTPARSWVSDNRLHAILDRVVAYPPGEHWSGDTIGRRDLRRASVATREALSPIERLEIALHPWVAFAIMPIFALANAGIRIVPSTFDAVLASAIFVAFVVGKPVGVVIFSSLAVKLRLAVRPDELRWSMLAAGSALTGIGFTMALFIATLAFDPALLDSVKLGILAASIVSAAGGLAGLLWLTARSRSAELRKGHVQL